MIVRLDDKIRRQLRRPDDRIVDYAACEIHMKAYSWLTYLYRFELWLPSGKTKETARDKCICCKHASTACDCSFIGKTEHERFLMKLEGYEFYR